MKTLDTLLEEADIDMEIIDVDFEMAMIEAAMNGKETFMFEEEEYKVDISREDAEAIWGNVDEALSLSARRKKSIQMKKGKAKRLRKRKIAEKKLSTPDKLKKKSDRAARKVIEKKILKGKSKDELSFAQRQQLEKKVDKKKGAIKRISKRLKKDVKKADRERVKARRSAKNEDVEHLAEGVGLQFTNYKQWETQAKKMGLLIEAYKKGATVIPKIGPHKGVKHEIIADLGNKRYNIRPIGIPANKIKYRLGAAAAKEADLELVKENTFAESGGLAVETISENKDYLLVTGGGEERSFSKTRGGLNAAYKAASKEKLWKIYYVDAKGNREEVDSSDN